MSNPISARQLERLFPHASRSCRELNSSYGTGKPDPSNRGGSLAHPKWSEQEDEILRKAYASGDAEVIIKLPHTLGRSRAGISCRAGELGVSFQRGTHPRVKKEPLPKKTPDELRALKSEIMKQRHRSHPHPMLGKPVPQETRDKISKANSGKKRSPESIQQQMMTRSQNGILAPSWSQPGRSWRSGWREIGGKRIFARSRWEANYARYLQFQKEQGLIVEWEHEPETFWFLKIKRGSRSYLPDFRVTLTGGSIEYHETKGWMDQRSKTKIKRMKIYYPDIVLVVKDSSWFKSNCRKLKGLIHDWE